MEKRKNVLDILKGGASKVKNGFNISEDSLNRLRRGASTFKKRKFLVIFAAVIVAVLFTGASALIYDYNKSLNNKNQQSNAPDASNYVPPVYNLPPPEPIDYSKKIEIVNSSFVPNSLTIIQGETVKWTNYEFFTCTLIFNSSNITNSTPMSFKSNYSYAFSTAENYTYYCAENSRVKGFLIVNAIPLPPPAPPLPPPVPVQVPTIIEINAQRLQTLFQKSSYFTKLPGSAAILLTFFDGNGQMRSEKLFISGGGVISNYAGGSYDLEFTMGDYRIPELEGSSDFCAALAKIKSQQDLRVSLKNILSVTKYAYLKSCVPF
ncbi:MAG: hypothetical protein NTX24_01120 [Candidatus Pacearchaeota archaeon]|nr:hypothetical protein [Candidatus Pacearchaeota archaeon]